MTEPIQEGGGQLLIAKDLHLFAKSEMARDHRGALAMSVSGAGIGARSGFQCAKLFIVQIPLPRERLTETPTVLL
jgi:hypothetical protein